LSDIQSVEGRPIKKGMSPGRRSAFGALAILAGAIGVVLIGQALRPAMIPADHDLALVTADGAVHLARSDGSAFAPLAGAGIPTDATSVEWAPGGDFVALLGATGLTVVDREGIVAWRHALSTAGSVAWSPDGSRVAVYDGAMKDATLEVLASTGALQWKVPLPDDFVLVPGYANLAWSPDGRTIAFIGTPERVESRRQPASAWLADVEAQAFRLLTQDAGAFDYAPAWPADDTLYLARASALETAIWRVQPTTGERTLVLRTSTAACEAAATCPPANLGPVVPSPDGTALAFRDPEFGLSVLHLASGETRVVEQPGALAEPPFAWSMDGAALFSLLRAGGGTDSGAPPELARFDLASGTTTVVVAGVRAFDLLASPE
jgi:dipeptidyl aminopeptidase/acylaminoacyl peptidase